MKPTKICAVCGRVIEWRRKWASNWEQIRYCSGRCRGERRADESLESLMLEMVGERKGSLCPSEVARRFFGEERWREQMERTRCAARRLVAAGAIEITQKGRVVDPSTARGPIRLRSAGIKA